MSNYINMQTMADVFKFFSLDTKPEHPLVTVIDFSTVKEIVSGDTMVSAEFYVLLFKNYNKNNVRYGRKVVDFQDGSLICLAPGQVLELEDETDPEQSLEGWGLFFHPDLIRGTSLGEKIKQYTYFSYETSEALHMSDKEKLILGECMLKISGELQENIDVHSQTIIVSTIELLLNYCSRFYGRQFITRKSSNHSVVAQVEHILNEYFSTGQLSEKGLPTVKYLADKVNLSPGYLSDLLKKETGKNTQDHIHFHLIEEAKNILLSTNRSIGEIAYGLGFEYPQYFNKLFKQKTGKTPVEFRSMN